MIIAPHSPDTEPRMLLYDVNETSFRLDTDDTTYLIGKTKYGHLEHIYYGSRLSKEDGVNVLAQKRSIVTGAFPSFLTTALLLITLVCSNTV